MTIIIYKILIGVSSIELLEKSGMKECYFRFMPFVFKLLDSNINFLEIFFSRVCL